MTIREMMVRGATPVARKVSSAITMRLVGYAIVRSVVGPEKLQRAPWKMSERAVQKAEQDFRRYFKMTSAEWVDKYAEAIPVDATLEEVMQTLKPRAIGDRGGSGR